MIVVCVFSPPPYILLLFSNANTIFSYHFVSPIYHLFSHCCCLCLLNKKTQN